MSLEFSQEAEAPLVLPTYTPQDAAEIGLRPKLLSDYTGQEKAKGNLSVYIEAARRRNEPLDHVLLYGPPGLMLVVSRVFTLLGNNVLVSVPLFVFMACLLERSGKRAYPRGRDDPRQLEPERLYSPSLAREHLGKIREPHVAADDGEAAGNHPLSLPFSV